VLQILLPLQAFQMTTGGVSSLVASFAGPATCEWSVSFGLMTRRSMNREQIVPSGHLHRPLCFEWSQE
jgi:hypothetical protein